MMSNWAPASESHPPKPQTKPPPVSARHSARVINAHVFSDERSLCTFDHLVLEKGSVRARSTWTDTASWDPFPRWPHPTAGSQGQAATGWIGAET